MRKNKQNVQRFKSVTQKCVTLLLVVSMLAQGLLTAVSAIDFSSIGLSSNNKVEEIISAVAKGDITYLEENAVSAAMRDEILKSFRQDLVKRVEEYELTGPVGVVLSFSDSSLINIYTHSGKADEMSYAEYKETDEAKELERMLEANHKLYEKELLDSGLITDVKHSYVHILDGIFVNTTYENISQLCEFSGVERVTVSA